jgi:hypothetical protein
MKQYETDILINAPKEEVWATLMDHASYASWNPFIVAISGGAEVGSQLQVSLQLDNAKPMNFEPVVLVNKTGREFRWRGKMLVKGLFDGEHYFKLEAINERETRLIHGEIFSGLLTRPILSMIGKKTLSGFKTMNEALKARIEKRADHKNISELNLNVKQ